MDDTGKGLAGLEEVQGEETLTGGSAECWLDWMRCRCGLELDEVQVWGRSGAGEEMRMV